MSMIKLENVSKFYYNKKSISSGFTKLNLELNMGEFIVITGESGSGKSTLLNVISGLDSYEEGEMYINGEETSHYTEVDYENYRRKYIGNIFQHFNLVNSYTVYQNVELVLLLNGYTKKEARPRVEEIIDTVGLTKYKNTKASKLSGGQKQRVAIARALAKDTPIITADEPTGNLDVKSAKSIMKLLKDISKDKLVVIVTHNYEQVEEYATRKISMNDGHIIEDKKIASTDTVEAVPVKYKDISKLNEFLIGLRNAFNIKTKFILLFLVYFFLTFLVFSEFSSLSKQEYDQSLEGYNPYFAETASERVILKKSTGEIFTDEDISALSKLNNIKEVKRNDLMLDVRVTASDEEVYFDGRIRPISELDKVDLGSMPKSDADIIVSAPKDSYYFQFYDGELIGREIELRNDSTWQVIDTVRISGVKYSNEDENDSVIYVSDEIIKKLDVGLSANYSSIYLNIGNKIYDKEDYEPYFEIVPNDKVSKGRIFTFEGLNTYCPYYNCLYKKIDLKVKNLYYEDSKTLSVSKVLNKDNFKSSTGLKNWDEHQSTIFMNPEDYKDLFYKGDYQVSVFLDDLKNGDETIEELESRGYQTYYMKDNIINPARELNGLLRIFSSVVFIIATIALFFISYFIIKIILNSRNIYFSTIRILGATKKVSKRLLSIELFVDVNIAYIVFLGLVMLAQGGIIKSNYIMDMITYFKFIDYVLIYLVLVLMSYLISIRYAHKLFKSSAMKTYREEV